jgi:hypothetical protein
MRFHCIQKYAQQGNKSLQNGKNPGQPYIRPKINIQNIERAQKIKP